MSDISAAKDIRVFAMSALFTDIKELLMKRLFNINMKINNRYFISDGLKLLVAVVRDLTAYAYCIYKVMDGTIGVPDFVVIFCALTA